MVSLIANTPLAGRLPLTIGDVEITEIVVENAWLIAPFAGKKSAVSAALKAACGMVLPKAGRASGTGARIIWMAGGQWLLIADALPDLTGLAAVTEQADGLAAARVSGPATEDVLARLVPMDLRPAVFTKGATARTLLGHMMCSITRVDADAVEVMVMRSMAGTLVHDLERAAQGVAGR